MTYSIAIRTLGRAGEKFRIELESIAAQTVQPERVIVYIAEGYPRPEITVGKEEYVWVKKGMVAQRALHYDEITSDCILMLDDDVLLAPDSAERLIKALEDNDLDCVGADVFRNQEMSLATKVKTALMNWVFPHRDKRWAFKMHRTGSFSYNNNPEPRCYRSQTCGGPAMLWRKDSFLGLSYEDELWLDSLGFAYGDDGLLSYKLHLNGGRLGVLYEAGVDNLDAGTASGRYRRGAERMYIRTKALLLIWWRTCYRNGKDTSSTRMLAAAAFVMKSIWMLLPMCMVGRLGSYLRGLCDGIKITGSDTFRAIPPFVTQRRSLWSY